MKTTKNLALALALAFAATGCAADITDGPNDPSDPSDPSDPPLPEDVDASGRYQLKSSIDLAQNAPGKAGDIARMFIDATDDADDPTSWILDQVIGAMSSGTVKNILQSAKPFVAGFINDRLLQIAPDFVTTMLAMGNDFGQVARTFGLEETLEVSKAGGGYMARHSVLGARFTIDGVESTHLFADYGSQAVSVDNVSVAVEPSSGRLTVGEHTIGLAYGSVLRIALDGAIIPSLDPSSTNLGQLFQKQVNCQIVGDQIHAAMLAYVGFSPGASTFRTACTLGLQKSADLIYSKIAEIDGTALELGIAGTAKALDKNNDRQIDTIQTGAWEGTMAYGNAPATLTGATFYGSRM
jgi:hypothetical protein